MSAGVRPGQVWLCREHLDDNDAECMCGLMPYLPLSTVEPLEQQLAGAVAALEAALNHARVGENPNADYRGVLLNMVDELAAALVAARGQSAPPRGAAAAERERIIGLIEIAAELAPIRMVEQAFRGLARTLRSEGQ
jgi:hypothetical protein